MICFMHSETDDTLLGTEHEESEEKILGLANTDFELISKDNNEKHSLD